VVQTVGTFLDGVRQRMPEVELAAVARLALVAFDDICLHADRRRNGIRKQVGVGTQGVERRGFDTREKAGIGDDGRLDDFGQSGTELPVGERAQHPGVADHEPGLRKRSRHILVSVDIHAVLAAHAGVDLPQQGRRDEAEIEAAHVGRGGETRHVGHDTAPDPQHESRPVDAQFDEAAVDRFDGLQGLYTLPEADQHRIVRSQHRVVEPVYRGIGYDDHASLGQYSRQDVGRGPNINPALLPDVEGGFHNIKHF
jgi:hypothetical protein